MHQLLFVDKNTHKIVWIQDTVNRFAKYPRKTKFIGSFGTARGGKSALLNVISGNVMFKVSPMTDPETEGVWISDPFPQPDGTHIVYVDSEGTEASDKSDQYKILGMTALICSGGGVLMQNCKTYGNNTIELLGLTASLRNVIKGLHDNAWPALCFLIRDFNQTITVEKRPATPEQWLEYLLSKKGDQLDDDRQIIKECFKNRFLFTLPAPSTNDSNDKVLKVPLPEGPFKTQVEELRRKITDPSVLSVKKIDGHECDRAVDVELLKQCAQKLDESNSISFVSAVQTVMDNTCDGYQKGVFTTYKENMKSTTENLNGDDAALTRKHTAERQSAVQSYKNLTSGLYANSIAKYEAVLTGAIDSTHTLNLARNKAVREEQERKRAEAAKQEEARRRQAAEAAQRVAEAAKQEEERKRQAAEAAQRAAQEAQRVAEEAQRAAEARARQAEQEAQRRDNSTFLNHHGFKIGGKRIW